MLVQSTYLTVLMICLHFFLLSVMYLHRKPTGQLRCVDGEKASLVWFSSLSVLFVVCVFEWMEKWTMLICLHHVHSFCSSLFTPFYKSILDVLSLSTRCTNLYILLNMHTCCKDGLIFT